MSQRGLYWPSGRNLFLHRPYSGLRMVLWFLCASVILTALAALYFR
jgi:hypothetical protein